ncbi:MAG: ATP-binding protein [Gammaproteobacteria bacterium]
MNKDKELINIVSGQSSVKHNILGNDLFTAIFDYCIRQMPGAIYYKNKNGKYLGCSNYLITSSGFSSGADVIGKTDFDLFSAKQAEILRKNDEKVINNGKILITEEKITLLNGDTQYFEVVKTPLRDVKGKIVGIIGNSIEVTDRVKAEKNLIIAKAQAEKANKLKSEFISNMEHDLRTPSSGIMGMTKILEEQETDSNKKEILHLLSQASERLLNVLNGVVAFDKAEAGIIPTTDQEFSIKKTVNDILAMEQPYVVSKKLELTAEYDSSVPEIVIGDEQRIFRVLLNLVGNAVKFTKKGHITVYAKVSKVIGQQNIMLQLIVEDTGIGIPKNKIKDIYERFVRGTPSNQGIYEGSGLGLSVVKRFIEDMSGEINAESVVNKGTKFTCNIPVKLPLSGSKGAKVKSTKTAMAKKIKKAEKPKKAKKVEKAKPEQKTKTAKTTKATETTKKSKIVKIVKTIKPKKPGIRLLLVEDDILAQTLASNMIKEKLTNNLDVADSGEKAIKLTGKNKYDLIFMDIGLPNIKGYDVTRKIRGSKTGKNQKTVIVALTAHVSPKEKKKCLDAQMNHFLTKPLSGEKIEEVLKTLLSEETTKTTKKEPSKTKISEKMSADSDLLKIKGEVIDLKLGMEKLSCDAEQAKKTIELFIKLLKEDMPQLTEAKNKGDWKTVKDLAHKHRGGSLYCGIPRLQQAFTNLEHYLITDKTELREQLYQQLLDEIDKLYAAQEKL